MANNVYRGSDGTISLAVTSGPAGDKAKAIADEYGLTPIGRVTGVTVNVTSDVKPFHELGQRIATELRSGNVNVSGTVDRAYINGALLKLMLGDAATSRPAGAFIAPMFNLSVRLENPSQPGNSTSLTVHGVRFDNWAFSLPEDDFVTEKLGFQALWVQAEDATA